MSVKRIRLAITLAAITFMPLFLASCAQTEPHHDTTYVWGRDNWDAVWPADNVAASADSSIVDNVFLKYDGRSLKGCPTTEILRCMNKVIDCVSVENRYKIQGIGVLNDIYIRNDQCVQDSIALARMGFKFGNVIYKPDYNR